MSGSLVGHAKYLLFNRFLYTKKDNIEENIQLFRNCLSVVCYVYKIDRGLGIITLLTFFFVTKSCSILE